MRWKQTIRKRLFLFGLILFLLEATQAEDPCVSATRRALVLSGGGAKGAFEAGAIYHLVVQRHCDFHEFSGASVGALNSAFLAQAERSSDPSESFDNLATQTEGLVSLWQSIKGSADIRNGRHLATLRFGLFGLESLNDLTPLRRLLDRNISTEKLAKGRPMRASVVSFWSGEYREVLAQPLLAKGGGRNFLDYLYASSVLPVYGKLPRMPHGSPADDPKQWSQFSDGSLRHMTPVASYFRLCKTDTPISNGDRLDREASCNSNSSLAAPAHEAVEQLFVVVTSPYSRDSDLLPVNDAKCCRPGTRQITDGRKILARTLALMDDTGYRWDLNYFLLANDMLRWRRQAYEHSFRNTPTDQFAEAGRESTSEKAFAVESYNVDPHDSDAPSLPYDIGLVAPKKEFADTAHLLTLSPPIIQEQLYCGCMAANQMMEKDFNLPSFSDQCARRFPPLLKKRNGFSVAASAEWELSICENTQVISPTAQTMAAE